MKNCIYSTLILVCAVVALPLLANEPVENSRTQNLLCKASLAMLKEGNARFIADKPSHPNAGAPTRTETATAGQEPLVTILSCSDSRVPVELIFDRGIGELFTVRIAGNVADTDEIATIEYGVGHLRTPLLIVLGHTRCGAVTAVVKGAEVHGLLPQLVDNIQPAVQRAKENGGDEKTVLANAIRENVWQSISDVLRRSSVIREAVEKGQLNIVGSVYDLDSGKVEWLGELPTQKDLLVAYRKETVAEHAPAKPEPAATVATTAPTAPPESHVAPPATASHGH